MELRACIEALKFIASEGPRLRVSRAVVYTDSQYVCDGERTPISVTWTSVRISVIVTSQIAAS